MKQKFQWVWLLFAVTANGEEYPFDEGRWQVTAQNAEFTEHLGEQALFLDRGVALLKGVQLTDAVIEFDISVAEVRGFSGARFRVQDSTNYEHFYIRPHQSGNPDANQYTPVINGVAGWQLYHGEGYGAPVEYRFNEWMHVKIVFRDSRAEIFIDSDEPQILVPELKRQVQAGGIGVDANFAPAYFANFSVAPLPDGYRLAGVSEDASAEPAELVSSWLVSDSFDKAELDDADALSMEFRSARHWSSLAAEPGGITNLARIQGIGPDKDTAIASVVVESGTDQVKGVSFGYSDAVSVYLNGTRLYSGSTLYMSRDYRYLGTIGLFDKVYLPLKAGQNELWFAVSEAFGGWGIQARFDDIEGIKIIGDP